MEYTKNKYPICPTQLEVAMLNEGLSDVPDSFFENIDANNNNLDMNRIVGSHDILMVCLDTLRYDIAVQEYENGGTPVLNSYGPWQKCSAPGNFTYPSHHAMFAGFLPSPLSAKPMTERNMLFFPKGIGMGRFAPKKSFAFEGPTFIEGLEKVGYETICIGGVAFFDKHSDIGKVFPKMFKHSYYQAAFGCTNKDSAESQIDFLLSKIDKIEHNKRIFAYVNISAIHYPSFFYLENNGKREDTVESHAAAFRYVDGQLGKLFKAFKARGKTFVMALSDHGTCLGEDGYTFHGFNHEIVNTVPYKHFVL